MEICKEKRNRKKLKKIQTAINVVLFFFFLLPLFVLRGASSYLPEYGYRPAAN